MNFQVIQWSLGQNNAMVKLRLFSEFPMSSVRTSTSIAEEVHPERKQLDLVMLVIVAKKKKK